LPSSNGD